MAERYLFRIGLAVLERLTVDGWRLGPRRHGEWFADTASAGSGSGPVGLALADRRWPRPTVLDATIPVAFATPGSAL
jgi:hypothetical protein